MHVDDPAFESGSPQPDMYDFGPVTSASPYEGVPYLTQPPTLINSTPYIYYTTPQTQIMGPPQPTQLDPKPSGHQPGMGRRRARREAARARNNAPGGYQQGSGPVKYRKKLNDPEVFARLAAGRDNKNAIEKVMQDGCVLVEEGRARGMNDRRARWSPDRKQMRENLPFRFSPQRQRSPEASGLSSYGSYERARPMGQI